MLRNMLAVTAIALASTAAIEPAFAQRGDHGRDRGDNRGDRGRDGGNWNRGDHDRDHGGGWDRGNGGRRDYGRRDRGWDHDWNRGYSSSWGYGRGYYYRDNDWWVGMSLGSTLLDYALTPSPRYYGGGYTYGYSAQAPNAWGLRPNECRWDREFGYWYDIPADIEVQRCADGYGAVYVVQGSHRLLRYR